MYTQIFQDFKCNTRLPQYNFLNIHFSKFKARVVYLLIYMYSLHVVITDARPYMCIVYMDRLKIKSFLTVIQLNSD